MTVPAATKRPLASAHKDSSKERANPKDYYAIYIKHAKRKMKPSCFTMTESTKVSQN